MAWHYCEGWCICLSCSMFLGKGIESELPEVVNCSARTGLHMLRKHYAEAIGFGIVFFLPASEGDFASYTAILRYLGSKNRAGVAKFDDCTTLFLVPPSDFLSKVLKVVGPERLYGGVLKLPQQSMHVSHTVDRQNVPLPYAEYGLTHLKEEQVLPVDYGRFSHDDPNGQSKKHFLRAIDPILTESSSIDYGSSNTATVSQAVVNLTPDLIATLGSFLPATQSAEVSQPAPGLSSVRPFLCEPQSHLVEQLRSQLKSQTPPPLTHHYASLSNTPRHSAYMLLATTQFQESTASLPQQAAASSRPLTNFSVAPQSAHVAVSLPVGQQYQYAALPNTHKGYGVVQGTEASSVYGSSTFQQLSNPTAVSNQVNFWYPQNIMTLSAEKVNLEHTDTAGIACAPWGWSGYNI